MNAVLRVIGAGWMLACFGLWVWIGANPIAPDGDGVSWSVSTMARDSQYGLTFLPLLLAIPGAFLFRRGRSGRNL